MRSTNLVADVTREVCASPNGRRRIDELQKTFPRFTRVALQKALENAAYKGFIHLLFKGEMLGRCRGREAGEWGPVPEWQMDPETRAKRRLVTEPEPKVPYVPKTVWIGGPPNLQQMDLLVASEEATA